VPFVGQTAELLSLKKELVLKLKDPSKNNVMENSKLKLTGRKFGNKKTRDSFLGAFGELRKSTSGFIMPVRPSVSPH
jgi:hypothetical protein